MYEADTMETQEACCSGESIGNTEETATELGGSEIGGGSEVAGVLDTHAHHQQLNVGLDFTHHVCKLESDTESMSPCLSTSVSDEKISHSLYSDAVVASVNGDTMMLSDNYSSSSEPGGVVMEPACVSVSTDTTVKSTVLFTSPSTSVFSPDAVQDKMNVIPSTHAGRTEQESFLGQAVSADVSQEDKRVIINSHPVVIGNAGAASFVQSVLKDLKVEPTDQVQPQPMASAGYILLGQQAAVLPGLVSLISSVPGSVPAPVFIQFPQSMFSSLATQPNSQAVQMETVTADHVTTLPTTGILSDSVGAQTPGSQSTIIAVSGVEKSAELSDTISPSVPAERVTSCSASDSLPADSVHPRYSSSDVDMARPEQETCPQEKNTTEPVRKVERAVVIGCVKPDGQRGKGMQQMIDYFMQHNTGASSNKSSQSLEEGNEQQSDSDNAGETGLGQTVEEAPSKLEVRTNQAFTDGEMARTGGECGMEVTPDVNVSSQMTGIPLRSHPLVTNQAILQGNGFYPAWTGTQFPNSPVVLIVKDIDHTQNGASTLPSLQNMEMSDFSGYQVGQTLSEETPEDEVDGTSRTSLHSRQSFIHVLSSVAMEAEQLRAKEVAQQQCLTVQQICSAAQVQQSDNSLSSIPPTTQLSGGGYGAESVIVTQSMAASEEISAIPDARPIVVRVQFPVTQQQPSLAVECPTSTQRQTSIAQPSVAPELLSAAELHLSTRFSENESSLQKSQNPDDSHSSKNMLAVNAETGGVQDLSSNNEKGKECGQAGQAEDVSTDKVVRPIILLVVQEDGSTKHVPINPVGSTVQDERPINTNFAIAAACAMQSDEDVTSTSPPTTLGTHSISTTIETCPAITSKDETVGSKTAVNSRSSAEMDIGKKTSSTKSKRFSCDLCTATFSCLGNYTRHRKVHTLNPKEDKPHTCAHCGRAFLQRCDMLRHVLIHTKQEPFRCKTCGKGYIRKSDLVVHERFHSKTRAFKCDECSSCFYQSGDLRRHKRTVHCQQSQLTCSHCQRKYAKEITLIRHMKTCHNDLLQSVSQATQKG